MLATVVSCPVYTVQLLHNAQVFVFGGIMGNYFPRETVERAAWSLDPPLVQP
jgi:hypothetical protein